MVTVSKMTAMIPSQSRTSARYRRISLLLLSVRPHGLVVGGYDTRLSPSNTPTLQQPLRQRQMRCILPFAAHSRKQSTLSNVPASRMRSTDGSKLLRVRAHSLHHVERRRTPMVTDWQDDRY